MKSLPIILRKIRVGRRSHIWFKQILERLWNSNFLKRDLWRWCSFNSFLFLYLFLVQGRRIFFHLFIWNISNIICGKENLFCFIWNCNLYFILLFRFNGSEIIYFLQGYNILMTFTYLNIFEIYCIIVIHKLSKINFFLELFFFIIVFICCLIISTKNLLWNIYGMVDIFQCLRQIIFTCLILIKHIVNLGH